MIKVEWIKKRRTSRAYWIGLDWRNKIQTIDSITEEVQLWCVRYMVIYNVAVEMQDGGQWGCVMMGIMADAARYDDRI